MTRGRLAGALAAIGIIAVVAVVGLEGSASAAAVGTGSITGTVIADDTGVPLEGVCVNAYDSATDNSGSAVTGPAGIYHLDGLPPGDYLVDFADCADDAYAPEFYDDAHDLYGTGATPVMVQADATATGVDAGLAPAGRVTGTVTADDTGLPLEGICVYAYPAKGQIYNREATTGPDGSYEIRGLAARDDYLVLFFDCSGRGYLQEFYDNGDFPRSRAVVQSGSVTSGINAGLAPGGQITGTVTDETSGEPLEGICVSVTEDGSSSGRHVTTGPDGTYALIGLGRLGSPDQAPVVHEYMVTYTDCANGVYVTEFYDDALFEEDATLILARAGEITSGINASLAPGGRIAGTVTADDTGLPLEGICVSAFVPFESTRYGQTGADGSYAIGALAAGDYRVSFSDCTNTGYLEEYYDDVTEDPTVVTVTSGATTGGINAALGLGGHITGTVSAEDTGQALEDICVYAYTNSAINYGSDRTGPDGTFDILGLPSRDYRVRFVDCADTGYRSEYFDDSESVLNSVPVAVEAPDTTSGINAALAPGGHITGTVTAEDTGLPLEGICVNAYDLVNDDYNYGYTGPDGTYDIDGLNAATHRVNFTDCTNAAYLDEYYDNAQFADEATPVSVEPPAATSGIDAVLSPDRGQAPDDYTGPGVDIITPGHGAVYPTGASVTAEYSCVDEVDGSGIDTCVGTLADGTAVDTSTPGTFEFTVTATDNANNTATVTHTYTIELTPPPPPPGPDPDNTLRIKKRLVGDVPDGAEFIIRVRCFASDGDIEEQTLTFDDNEYLDLNVPADHPRCRIRETARGGADTTTYRATSPTAQVTSRAHAGWVTFGNEGGEGAKTVVTNRWNNPCPRPGPQFC